MSLHLVASTPSHAMPDRDSRQAKHSVPLIQIRPPHPQERIRLLDQEGRMAPGLGFMVNLITSIALGSAIVYVVYKVINQFL